MIVNHWFVVSSLWTVLLVFYLMFQVGICQCIARSLCKMCWAACQTYWFLFEYITCFVWHKLKNTKRVNRRRRRRFRDVEVGCSSDGESVSLEVDQSFNTRKLRRKRKDRVESSFYPSRQNRYANDSHRNRPRFKGDRYQRFKYSRQLQMRKLSNIQRESTLFKKRGFRWSSYSINNFTLLVWSVWTAGTCQRKCGGSLVWKMYGYVEFIWMFLVSGISNLPV